MSTERTIADPDFPAFPHLTSGTTDDSWTGLSFRQYAAIHALAGILADKKIPIKDAVDQAVKTADALIDQLNK